MCVAIMKPAGLVLDKTTLDLCRDANKDGQGFSYVDASGNLQLFKTMDYEEFFDAYKAAEEENPTSPFLLHFRIATHGTVDEFNCHPFWIDNKHVFIHNGVIRHVSKCKEKKHSDTQMFNQEILQQLPKKWTTNSAITQLIEEFIGYSKLVVLNSNKEIFIYNENLGDWEDGVWFSNLLWKPKEKTSYYSSHTSDYHKYCWNCNCFIGDSEYYKTTGKFFCSKNCRDKWETKYPWPSKTELKCDYCYDPAYITVVLNGINYHYCCHGCRELHQKELNADVAACSDHMIMCAWCQVKKKATEMILVEYDDSEDFICSDCMPDAVRLGFIEDTKEAREILDEITKSKEKDDKEIVVPKLIVYKGGLS